MTMRKKQLILLLLTWTILLGACRSPAGQTAASQTTAAGLTTAGSSTAASQTNAPQPSGTVQEKSASTTADQPVILQDLERSLDELAGLTADLDDVSESDLVVPEA
jgi:hypothetical protein